MNEGSPIHTREYAEIGSLSELLTVYVDLRLNPSEYSSRKDYQPNRVSNPLGVRMVFPKDLRLTIKQPNGDILAITLKPIPNWTGPYPCYEFVCAGTVYRVFLRG